MATSMTDGRIIELYGLWSEHHWAAGFMKPDPDVVREFRGWLADRPEWNADTAPDYEVRMITEFHRQDHEEGTTAL